MVFSPRVENVLGGGDPSLHRAACGSALPGSPVIRAQNCTVRFIRTQRCVARGAGKRKDRGGKFIYFFSCTCHFHIYVLEAINCVSMGEVGGGGARECLTCPFAFLCDSLICLTI